MCASDGVYACTNAARGARDAFIRKRRILEALGRGGRARPRGVFLLSDFWALRMHLGEGEIGRWESSRSRHDLGDQNTANVRAYRTAAPVVFVSSSSAP